MTLDPQLAAVLAAAEGSPPINSFAPADAQALYEQMAQGLQAAAGPPIAVKEAVDGEIAGVPVRVYRPEGSDGPVPTIVFAHGGGWVLGSLDTHDGHARRLTRDLGAVVVSVGYRLAPQHRFPAGVDDVTAVFDAVAGDLGEYGGDPARLGVAGDSAGATLAAVLALHARDADIALAAQLLIYPATDLSTERASMSENAEGYSLTRDAVRWLVDLYLDSEAQVRDPRVSPALSDTLVGLAPAVVVTAEFDPLRDDGDDYAQALRSDGVTVVHRSFEGIIHGFMDMTPLSAACDDATAWSIEAFGTLLRS